MGDQMSTNDINAIAHAVAEELQKQDVKLDLPLMPQLLNSETAGELWRWRMRLKQIVDAIDILLADDTEPEGWEVPIESEDSMVDKLAEAAAKPSPKREKVARPPQRQPTKSDWKRARHLYEMGDTLRDIAQKTGSSVSTVKRVRAGEGWQRNEKATVTIPHTNKSIIPVVKCPNCERETSKNPCAHCYTKLPSAVSLLL